MAAVIGGTPGLANAWSCTSGKEALGFLRRRPTEVVVASLFLKDMTGTDFVLQARACSPEGLFLLVLPDAQPNLLFEALEAGASGYLTRPCGPDELIRAIWTVCNGGGVVSSAAARNLVDYFRARGAVLRLLTDRERQVLKLLASGLPLDSIATELGIDRETVRSHVRNVLSKLQAHSTVEAIALYLNPKLPRPESDRMLPGF